jgi:plastocyanin
VTGSRVVGVLTVLFFAAFTAAGPAVIAARQADTSGGGDTRGAADAPRVEMRALKFQPATLTIKRGTTVTFDNADVAPHTVTVAGGPDSGIIAPGGSYDLTVDEQLDYVCTVHPAMKATIELSG